MARAETAERVADRDDPVGAFVPGERIRLSGAASGPLAGLTLGVKDVFEIAGHVTGFGNPDWARTHPPAVVTAPAVTLLCEAGAEMVGRTKTVELAAGLTGENLWYGTPTNPACPDRYPGRIVLRGRPPAARRACSTSGLAPIRPDRCASRRPIAGFSGSVRAGAR
ncbi:MAG: amidase family protein [Acetobacteraceae bacterium]|nr:amidase family protein [Acetobacteraceae bacterium]